MDKKIQHLKRWLEQFISRDPHMLKLITTETVTGFLLKDLSDPEVEYISPGFWKSLGVDPDSCTHRPAEWHQMLDGTDQHLILDNLEQDDKMMLRFRQKEGDITPYSCWIRHIEDQDNGSRYRLIVLTPTLDDQIRTLPDLSASSENAAFYLDQSLCIQRINMTAQILTGFSASEAIGQPLDHILTLVDENTDETIAIPSDFYRFEEMAELQSLKLVVVSKFHKKIPVMVTGAEVTDESGTGSSSILVLKNKTPYSSLHQLIQSRQSLISYASSHSLDELLKKALDDLGKIVNSPIGFYHFVNPDQKNLTLQQWSTRTLNEFCNISGKGMHYSVDKAGVWVECVRTRKPVIHNDYASLDNKKGLPNDHAKIIRELVVPVIRGGLIVAILGVGNKSSDYDERDTEIVSYFADVTWSIVEQKKLQEEMELQKRIDHELADLSALLLTQTNMVDISGKVLDVAKKLTKSRYGYVGTYEPETGVLTCHTMTRDIWQECMIPDKSIKFEKCTGLFGWVLDHKQPVMLNDIEGDPRSCGTPEGHIKINAFLGVPAMIGGDLVGQIALANPENQFLEIDLIIAKRLADLFASAVQRQQYHDHIVRVESKKAEELEKIVLQRTRELDASRYLMEKIFSSQLDAILVLDASDPPRIKDCNPAASKMFGYDKTELLNKSSDFLHETTSHHADFWEKLNTCVETDQHFYLEAYELKQQSGKTLPVRISATQMRGYDNNCLGWVLAIHDDSEQKRYERELKKNEEKFKAIADYTVDWENWLDPDGNLVWLNPAIERITGYSMAEYMKAGALSDQLGMIIIEEDLSVALSDITEALSKRKFINDRHYRIVKKDGQHSWISFSCRPIYSEDRNYLGIRTSIRDISEKKETEKQIIKSEQRLNLVLNSLRDGVWDWRLDNGDVYFSSRYYTMLGYDPDELPASYETWQNLIHPDDLDQAERAVNQALESGEPFEMEFRMLAKGGNWRWILGRGRAVEKDGEGRPLRMLGTHMDITQRKNLESRVRQSQKLEAVGTLAGGIAHDFNNILAGIIGYAELVMDDVEEGSRSYSRLNGIIDGSERARKLISQILTFSRKSEREMHSVDVRLVVKEALKLIRASMPATINIQQDIKPGLPFVMGDPTQIHQVIMNLSTNALHAMADGGTLEIVLDTLQISNEDSRKYDDLLPGEYIRLQLSDNGCGMSPEILPKIFDPFFTTKEKERGTGLGMSVVHGIIKDHNGDIRIHSVEGKGTDVFVFLPVHEHTSKKSGKLNNDQHQGVENILLVDDEEVLSVVAQDMLESMGYSVTALTDSVDALERFVRNPDDWDILLSDITMPVITGIDLAEKVQQIRPELPVILWSGDHSKLPDNIQQSSMKLYFLKKPFRQRELSKIVREALG